MNVIEERIRAAARAAGNTVSPESVPPLELPAERPRAAIWRWRWLVPAAAAAAVVLVAVTTVTVGQVTRTRAPGIAPTAAAPGPMLPGPSLASYVSSGTIPPYFVAVAFTGKPAQSPAVAVVHDTVTGKTLATIKPSIPGGTIQAVSAAGDGRTFVLEEQPWVKSPPGVIEYRGPYAFYLLRLDSAGRPNSLSRLKVTLPAKLVLRSFALSPDGKRLALAGGSGDSHRVDLIVSTLGDGTTRAWHSDGNGIGWTFNDPLGMSWTADGRTLAFLWIGYAGLKVPPATVRLLNLASASDDLLAASRQVMTLPRTDTPSVNVTEPQFDAIITPDGSAVVIGSTYWQVKKSGKGPPVNIRSGFAEYSTQTGKLVRNLGYWRIALPHAPVEVLWSSPSGRVLIGITGSGRIGVINGNEFTPLKAPPVPYSVIRLVSGAVAGTW